MKAAHQEIICFGQKAEDWKMNMKLKEIQKIGKTRVGTSQTSSNSADAVLCDILALVTPKLMTRMISSVGTADPMTKFMT